ncbi:helix-turn-helix domain-containing protein [Streptomyces sp. NPDC057620]|uniref:helix-turn-helix domain-containing protein n=1 Tax=Streptomyces sp. NPDC057620 TaxID=3346185 RepID=UPI0036AB9847
MTINVLAAQHPMPSHPRRRDGKTPLPAPEERARLRRAWHLTDAQVAAAFGVTAATVRSWESGRTTPTGLRRAAYAAFLSGLAQGLAPVAAGVPAPSSARRTLSPAARQRVKRPVGPVPVCPTAVVPQAVPRAKEARVAEPGRGPASTVLSVGDRPDPVAPARRRRLRAMTAATGLWAVFVHLMITSPPPHL